MHWSLPFWLLAAAGFLLSAVMHTGTFIGVNFEAMMPFPFGLHVGIFIVLVPAFIASSKDLKKTNINFNQAGSQLEYWKRLTKFAPFWMRVLLMLLIPYALFNFFFTLFILKEGGGPSIIDGQKVLSSHGVVIRALSDEEFFTHILYELRLFSGHWMVGYATAWVLLYSHFASKLGWPEPGRSSIDFVPHIPELTRLESDTSMDWLTIRKTYTCERCGYEGRGPWTIGDIAGLIAKISTGVFIVGMVTWSVLILIPTLMVSIAAGLIEGFLPGKRPCPHCSPT